MKLDVFDLSNNKVSELEVSDSVFGAEVKEHLIHDVVKAQLRLRRSGTAKTKGRSEVHGTTRKMYKQKGTGSARHGSKKAPLFPKGGTVFGPQGVIGKYRLNKKVMKGGLVSALSMLVKEGKVTVVESLTLESCKTKAFSGVLSGFGIQKSLVVHNYEEDKNVYLAGRNLKDVKVIKTEGVNVFDLLKYQNVFISESAIKSLEERLAE
jgi:large subunit ribosomal protein L4